MDADSLNVENPYRYSLRGYHPIDINQQLPPHEPRYHVVHKLGYGSFSTVWLAQDLRQTEPTYVAVKVLAADAKRTTEEARILRHLRRSPPPPARTRLPPPANPESKPKSLLPLLRISSLLRRLWTGLCARLCICWTGLSPSEVAFEDSARALTPGALPLLDEFDLIGPNGKHHCLVSPVVGPSVASLKRFYLENWMLPIELARRATVQLVTAVASLHSRGVAHGDLHIGNLALGLPALHGIAVGELYELLGPPKIFPPPFDDDDEEEECAMNHRDSTGSEAASGDDSEREDSPLPRSPPQYSVPPIETANLWSLAQHHQAPTSTAATSPALPASAAAAATPLYILDFGEAWLNTAPGNPLPPERTKVPGTPICVAPPEILIQPTVSEIGAAADIWTLACTIYELFSGRSLFQTLFGDGNEVIADVVAGLGKPPPRFWVSWTSRMFWFTEDGDPTEGRTRQWKGKALRLADKVKKARGEAQEDGVSQGMDEGDAQVLLRVLERALKYEPAERPTAQELLEMLPPEWADGRPALLT